MDDILHDSGYEKELSFDLNSNLLDIKVPHEHYMGGCLHFPRLFPPN